jgi:DNA helicase HerA-like ATPase
MTFSLPAPGEHTAIMGRTGSGKTVFGAWLLSEKQLMHKPTIIFDYKGDEILNGITRTREIENYQIPREPGLYILHASPDENEAVERYLMKIWAAENIDIYIDEGYMLPDENGFSNILTQGRSKGIGVTTLSQRPVAINRFVFSEASHVVQFHLNDRRDLKTVGEFTPQGFSEWIPQTPEFGGLTRLPAFHARWYNIKRDERFVLRPVPDGDKIIEKIDAQLIPKRRWL